MREDDLKRKRSTIFAYHKANAELLEAQAMTALKVAGEARLMAGYAMAMPMEEVEKVFPLIVKAMEKKGLAGMPVEGKVC